MPFMLCFTVIFTFQSGSIQMSMVIEATALVQSFTFQSGSIQIVKRGKQKPPT